jgi:hypothetical protein
MIRPPGDPRSAGPPGRSSGRPPADILALVPFVGLVHSREWDPPEPEPEPPLRPAWNMPWRALAGIAAFFGLLLLAPVVGSWLGGLAGYVVILLAVYFGLSRVEHLISRQYWRSLRDYQS